MSIRTEEIPMKIFIMLVMMIVVSSVFAEDVCKLGEKCTADACKKAGGELKAEKCLALAAAETKTDCANISDSKEGKAGTGTTTGATETGKAAEK